MEWNGTVRKQILCENILNRNYQWITSDADHRSNDEANGEMMGMRMVVALLPHFPLKTHHPNIAIFQLEHFSFLDSILVHFSFPIYVDPIDLHFLPYFSGFLAPFYLHVPPPFPLPPSSIAIYPYNPVAKREPPSSRRH